MKILLVNAYGSGKNARLKFNPVIQCVKEGLEALRKIGYYPPKVAVADMNTIDDYIYVRNSNYTKDEAKKVLRTVTRPRRWTTWRWSLWMAINDSFPGNRRPKRYYMIPRTR